MRKLYTLAIALAAALAFAAPASAGQVYSETGANIGNGTEVIVTIKRKKSATTQASASKVNRQKEKTTANKARPSGKQLTGNNIGCGDSGNKNSWRIVWAPGGYCPVSVKSADVAALILEIERTGKKRYNMPLQGAPRCSGWASMSAQINYEDRSIYFNPHGKHCIGKRRTVGELNN